MLTAERTYCQLFTVVIELETKLEALLEWLHLVCNVNALAAIIENFKLKVRLQSFPSFSQKFNEIWYKKSSESFIQTFIKRFAFNKSSQSVVKSLKYSFGFFLELQDFLYKELLWKVSEMTESKQSTWCDFIEE